MKFAPASSYSGNSRIVEEKPVLVFDSGIGGLTVLREARVLMPDRRFIYIADDAGFPYGNWKEEALRKHIVGLFGKFIAAHDPEIAVIACNTASTLVLDDLRHAYPSVPFVGTVPAIKPAAERTSSGLVSVLATPGTVKRAYTRDLIQSFASQCHVRLVGADQLASLAEAHIRGDRIDEALVVEQIAPCFVEHDGKRTDIVVLACTHYPFLANVFRRLAPWPVDWLDPAEAIARRTVSLLSLRSGNDGLHHHDDLAVFTSQKPDYAIRRLLQGFGLHF
ncbi:glutamate racemase [Ochrobactrum sp. CM-21-5]|nr:glutamate racemase [Ochrobactrum sp. CM-21-5]MBC2886818.1 glutamate racemase [Ochrobactrum sp. CM-21-5]